MSHGPTVLVVDDDHDLVRGVSMRLRGAGYEVLTAYDGEQGVAAAQQFRPDVIVLDMRMPRLDGLAALDRLHHGQDTRAIPVIMVSASLVDRMAVLARGASCFLSKPCQSRLLLAAIEQALQKA